MQPWEIVWDIEATDLLNSESIDYTSIPYKLKDSFKIHCIVVAVQKNGKEYLYGFHDGDKYIFDGREHSVTVDGNTYKLEAGYQPVDYIHRKLDDFPLFIKAIPENSKIIAHNQINYDLLAVKLYWGIPYAVEVDVDLNKELGDDYWDGKKVIFDDTLVRSKTLNPDRFGGHSLENLSQKGEAQKIAFRKHIPQEERFKHFGPDMLYYNIWDVKANKAVAKQLDEEMKLYGWNEKWHKAIKLEKAVAELITRQEHRGFKFDMDLAQRNLDELDKLMEERKEKIEKILPDRPATKKVQGEFTPPKIQFKKNGDLSSNLIKFAEKIGAEIKENTFVFNGKVYNLPLPLEPLVTTMKATINDTTHIKEWLVGLGWQPSEYKEKDLTTDVKKNRLSDEKIKAAIARYVEQTVESNFCKDRCEHLGIHIGPRMTKESIASKLKHELTKRIERKGGIKVLTNPSFTVGQEKEICPNLRELANSKEELNCITDITEYLTYRHRRNSILGGGADWDDEEEPEKGYLAAVREDGRIPTPADTCGAATSRMKHRLVANIPRVTSLYGYNMRAMFGVDEHCYQIGYDFDSLEAREEANYCWEYEEGDSKEYCNSLLQEKPNDVHSRLSQKISAIIARDFARGPAKAVKYGCVPVDNTEVLTREGWKFRSELSIGQEVLSFNKEKGCYEYTPITAFWDYPDAKVVSMSNKWFKVEVTEDHNWINKQRVGSKKLGKTYSLRRTATTELNTDSNIVAAAPSGVSSTLTKEEARFLGWLLSDGYFKWSGYSRNKAMGISVSIDQDNKKYLEEVREAVGSIFEYKEYVNGSMHKLQPNRSQFRAFLNKCGVPVGVNKHEYDWCSLIANQGADVLEAFLEAFWLADGHTRGKARVIRQKKGNISDAVALALNMTGHIVYASEQSDGMLSMSMSNGSTISGQRLAIENSRDTDVFCISTANESFVMRQNGFITLTGNCTYGAQGPKIAKTIGCDVETGNMIFEAFWEAAAPLKKLKDALNKEWARFDKKRIIGIDGRLVPTRSAHAILNSKFQSAGVICAKRAMVLHDRKLKAAGLLVDFFKDDWTGRDFCQQLIAYHDEAQLEVNKASVKFRRFADKEQAQAFKDERLTNYGEIWSDIKDSPKGGVYVAYCKAGQLAVESVNQSGKDYGMVVDLTAGYMVEKSWAGCH